LQTGVISARIGAMFADETPEPCEVVPDCPVCGSELVVAHAHAKLKICVCKDCGTSLSIPEQAWVRARSIRTSRAG
jgi:ribosomal protein L37AE/L43A